MDGGCAFELYTWSIQQYPSEMVLQQWQKFLPEKLDYAHTLTIKLKIWLQYTASNHLAISSAGRNLVQSNSILHIVQTSIQSTSSPTLQNLYRERGMWLPSHGQAVFKYDISINLLKTNFSLHQNHHFIDMDSCSAFQPHDMEDVPQACRMGWERKNWEGKEIRTTGAVYWFWYHNLKE